MAGKGWIRFASIPALPFLMECQFDCHWGEREQLDTINDLQSALSKSIIK
jgi:hypothetical protein